MVKINLQKRVCLVFMFKLLHYGASVNYNPYENKQTFPNSNNNGYKMQPTVPIDYSAYQQNQQGDSNYQQLYRYYYPPPYQQQQQQQQQQLQPYKSTQFWSGPPIVVEDVIQQQQSSENIPSQHSISDIRKTNELLPFVHSNSKVLSPTVYSRQPNTHTNQFNYNNNNNIVYHRDFRHQIDAIPESQHTQRYIPPSSSWNNQQQQSQLLAQQQQQQQQQAQQFYDTNMNLRYNGISNDLTTFRRDNIPDYREHFKRYLENNPSRIKPIY